MREIKFRAWDKTDKEMSYFSFTNNLVCISDKDDLHICSNSGGWDFYREGLEIMQYTGLKDKNGKEIYEGDILGFSDENEKVVVIWDIEIQGWSPKVLQAPKKSCWEVVGNIYENPDLIK